MTISIWYETYKAEVMAELAGLDQKMIEKYRKESRQETLKEWPQFLELYVNDVT